MSNEGKRLIRAFPLKVTGNRLQDTFFVFCSHFLMEDCHEKI